MYASGPPPPKTKLSITSPYATKTYDYRGQLHCHTTKSDGVDSPTTIMTAYRNSSYNFCCITDHNVKTADPGVEGILFISGVEETSTLGHIVIVNAISQNPSATAQTIIDTAIANGSFVVLAHPNWVDNLWTKEEIATIKNFQGIEIWNSGNSNVLSLDKWQNCNEMNRRCFLTVADDTHDISATPFGTTAVRVFANALSISEILENLKNGNYYCTYTPTGSSEIIMTVSIKNNVITVTVNSLSNIYFIGNYDVPLLSGTATTLSYTLTGTEGFVRIYCERGPSRSWTNPIYVEVV